MGDELNGPMNSGQPAARPAMADELREQQAIAAALMIGEQSRHEDRKQIYWITLRIGMLTAVISIFGLLILFAYSRIRQEFNPTLWMLFIGAVGAAGAAAAYWAYAEGRRRE
jgi:hypothetical protein